MANREVNESQLIFEQYALVLTEAAPDLYTRIRQIYRIFNSNNKRSGAAVREHLRHLDVCKAIAIILNTDEDTVDKVIANPALKSPEVVEKPLTSTAPLTSPPHPV